MPDNIDNMSDDLQKYAELQAYSAAQQRTILELNRKLNAMEQENVKLKKSLASVDLENKKTEDKEIRINVTDEQAICEMQLNILRDRSIEGELTLEEAKKVELFAKLLLQLRNPKEKPEEKVKEMDSQELLKFVLVDGGKNETNS
jgi:hypothetical protein